MNKYLLTKKQLARVKRCAKYAGMKWESIAARPSTAMGFCEIVEIAMRKDK